MMNESTGPSQSPKRDKQNWDGEIYGESSNSECENENHEQSVAIIGLAAKFPGDASDAEHFWETLLERRSALSKVPIERYNADAFDCPTKAHFIRENLGAFDAAFFTISPTEAENMDPQQRLFLETTYHVLENSGITLDQIKGSQTASWFYDLHGPSVVVDTACSSSLVALHQACQSLQSGDAEMGIVAGINILFDPAGTMNMDRLGFLSPDSKCYSFDHRANGYSRGEGVGAILIKPLSNALRDGNCIRAVIRATGSNQDGRTPGITQPSGSAQENLIRSTYFRAGLSMAKTRYFEAHGTGTAVGDPIEAKAIAGAFKEHHHQPLYVGAVKSNIGHLGGASGISGLIKTVLVLERGVIPANIWFERVNPQIDAEGWNLVFPTETTPWPTPGLRRASVNSFGFGGTNAHVIVDDAYHYLLSRGLTGRHTTKYQHMGSKNSHCNRNDSVRLNGSGEGVIQLLTLSAFDEAGIERLTSTLLKSHISRIGDVTSSYIEDVAYTINEKRTKLPWRSFCLATSKQSFTELKWSDPVRASISQSLCFVFTGQGAQWKQMGKPLLRFQIFDRAIEEADRFLASIDIYTDIDEAQYSQPLCTAVQIALVELLISWGVQPDVVVGHSSGEIAAAYCSRLISKETALRLSYYRGLAISQAMNEKSKKSSMMAVQLSADLVAPYLSPWNYSCEENDRITIAYYNSPHNITLSGTTDGLDALAVSLVQKGVLFKRLNIDVGYHSVYMFEAAAIYKNYPRSSLRVKAPEMGPRFVSTVTGGLGVSADIQTPDYWVSNLLDPVRFSDAISSVLSSKVSGKDRMERCGVDFIVEVGPHSALKSPIREILKSHNKDVVKYSSVLIKGHDSFQTTLDCMGKLHSFGHQVDLTSINFELARSRKPNILTDLPSYPFNHERRYWVESRIDQCFRFRTAGRHELLGAPVSDWNELQARWNNRLIKKDMIFLSDHKVNGIDVYPAAEMIVMAIEAIRQLLPTTSTVSGYRLKNVCIQSALALSVEVSGSQTQFTLRPSLDTGKEPFQSWSEFDICVFEDKHWRECCRGTIMVD
ncbi:polyketide synthase [Dendryphion nanum]|uniref:Polyketide synthase n=1 Tax=Dendryphion nanum TaxID=256645 RepID=A0A9P9IWY9_9PLEO|nr:polyketide synthase [Dendryphion nanum]